MWNDVHWKHKTKERFDQHLNGDSEHSALSEHIIWNEHKVEWEDAEVICTVRGDYKRFFYGNDSHQEIKRPFEQNH